MKVLVTNLSGVKKDENGMIQHYAKAGSRWPMVVGQSKSVDYYPFPFWLAYTSALLKRDTRAEVKGIDGVVLDMDSDQYLAEVKKYAPNILIVELTAISLEEDVKNLKTIKRETGALIAVAGNYPTAEDEKLLKEYDFIDYVLRKEYEITAKELVLATDEHKPLNDILGLSYREDGKIIRNADRSLLRDLDFLPFPDRDDFPATLYPDFAIFSPCINLIASRGCPGGCIYCQERHIMYNSNLYRHRDPKKIVDEIEYCIKKFGARQIYFDDQTFTVNNKFTQEICQEILDRKIKIPWTCMGDAMWVNEDTLKKMAAAGCIGMKFGVESIDMEILKRIGKPLDVEKLKKVVIWCKNLGIRTHATFIVGLPGATKETVLRDMEFLDELKPFTAQVALATPYPGTPFYKWAKENKYLITDDLSKYDGMGQSVLSYPNFSKTEMENLYAKFLKKVSRQKLKHFIFSPKSSFSIMGELLRRKGPMSLVNSVFTVIKRAI
ncbi:MAG TPA: radical SAM protein [Candidatus Methylomirabilis sp.]|nr:radical SAM protein [Candidatus Methylomirabilis sp.]